jgi:hypothetical protein
MPFRAPALRARTDPPGLRGPENLATGTRSSAAPGGHGTADGIVVSPPGVGVPLSVPGTMWHQQGGATVQT